MKYSRVLSVIVVIIVFSLLLVSCGGCSLPFFSGGPPDTLSILSYNVENLFDDVTNGTEYYQYDPSRGEWTTELFHRKLGAVSEALLYSPRGGADILVLQEVENLHTVETLRDHYLKGGGYRYTQVTDMEDSAIQLACLSRYPIVSAKTHSAYIDTLPETRPILECTLDVEGTLLTLLINHWKSKYGGAEETEPLRIASAAIISRRTEELKKQYPERDVIVVGDLNVRTDEYSYIDGAYPTALLPYSVHEVYSDTSESLFVTGNVEKADGTKTFFSPWLTEEHSPPGSYVYAGEWEQIDHFLFGPTLFDGAGVDYQDFTVVAPDFLLNNEGHPYSFYRTVGTGYSDHLPLLLELELVER